MAAQSDQMSTGLSSDSLLQDTDLPENLVDTEDDGFTLVTGKKRLKPMGGHSPEDRHPPTHAPQTPETEQAQGQRSPVRKTVSFKSNSEPRFTFIVKSAQPLDLIKITAIVSEILTDSTIVRHQLSAKGKIAMFKTNNPASPNPDHDLNVMLRFETAKIIHDRYGDKIMSFSVHHHDDKDYKPAIGQTNVPDEDHLHR